MAAPVGAPLLDHFAALSDPRQHARCCIRYRKSCFWFWLRHRRGGDFVGTALWTQNTSRVSDEGLNGRRPRLGPRVPANARHCYDLHHCARSSAPRGPHRSVAHQRGDEEHARGGLERLHQYRLAQPR